MRCSLVEFMKEEAQKESWVTRVYQGLIASDENPVQNKTKQNKTKLNKIDFSPRPPPENVGRNDVGDYS
jgi:hypothetical protein